MKEWIEFEWTQSNLSSLLPHYFSIFCKKCLMKRTCPNKPHSHLETLHSPWKACVLQNIEVVVRTYISKFTITCYKQGKQLIKPRKWARPWASAGSEKLPIATHIAAAACRKKKATKFPIIKFKTFFLPYS